MLEHISAAELQLVPAQDLGQVFVTGVVGVGDAVVEQGAVEGLEDVGHIACRSRATLDNGKAGLAEG